MRKRSGRRWPKGPYNQYRHILWETVRFKWLFTMIPSLAKTIAKHRHEFSRAQQRVIKRRLANGK